MGEQVALDIFFRAHGDLSQVLKQAETDLQAAKKGADDFSNAWERTLDLSQKVGAAVTAFGAAVTGSLGYATKEAMAAENSQQKLNIIYGEGAAALEQYAGALSQQSRFERDSIVQGEATGAKFSKLHDTLGEATRTALNMAEVMGGDVAGAMQVLGMASEGMTRGLKQVGVRMTAAEVDAGGMEAVYSKINERLNDVAYTNTTASKSFDQIKNAMHEVAETVGGQLLQSVKDVSPEIIGLLDKLKEFAATDAGGVFVKVGAGAGIAALAIGPVIIAVGSVIRNLQEVEPVAEIAWTAITGPAGAAVIAIAAVAAAWYGVSKAIDDAKKHREEFKNLASDTVGSTTDTRMALDNANNTYDQAVAAHGENSLEALKSDREVLAQRKKLTEELLAESKKAAEAYVGAQTSQGYRTKPDAERDVQIGEAAIKRIDDEMEANRKLITSLTPIGQAVADLTADELAAAEAAKSFGDAQTTASERSEEHTSELQSR
jgi:hypothetical protein